MPPHREEKTVIDDALWVTGSSAGLLQRTLDLVSRTPLVFVRVTRCSRARAAETADRSRERVTAYLTLPKAGRPPYQVVVFFPGLGQFQSPGATTEPATNFTDFIVKSGRAFVQPVFKGSYERWDGFLGLPGEEYMRVFRERTLQWYQDLGRTLDYLDTRPEFDLERVAYWGVSFGASVPLPLLAVESRLKTAILTSGGFTSADLPPESHIVNYGSHVTMPILMLNGRYDSVFPVETAQRPLFEPFGTRPADKRHVVLEAGHAPLPRGDLVRETLDWLDRYLGPVN